MPEDLSAWKVLIVDDEPDNLGVLVLVLGFHGAVVCTAESGTECLAVLQDENPTLLLVDIQMPTMSGYELLRAVRQDNRWQHLPIIAVSAHAMAGDSEAALEAGFDGYITKPISAQTLAATLKEIVAAKQNENGTVAASIGQKHETISAA